MGKGLKTVISVHIYKNMLYSPIYQEKSRVIINKSDSEGENGSSSFKEHPHVKNKRDLVSLKSVPVKMCDSLH